MKQTHNAKTVINQWGNSLAVRLHKNVLRTAGFDEGTMVKVTAKPGRIILEEIEAEPSLKEMLAAFDPKKHSGEVTDFLPVGKEIL